jgi:Secretion system C-terminal sorting domain
VAPGKSPIPSGIHAWLRGWGLRAFDRTRTVEHPNPFNPQTTISFGLPESAQVTLKVYDMMGREVRLLVRGTLSAGTHEATFDASGLPSGTYMYQLTTPEGRISKMMLLLR